jgi:hypothetical protein
MPIKTSRRRPKLDSAYRVFFEKKTALATGLGAAVAFVPGHTAGANDPADVMPLQTVEWRTSSLHGKCVIDDHIFPGQVSAPATRIVFPDIEEEWTDAQQRRFQELAVEEALGTLSMDEAAELEQLTLMRRALQNPRTGREILWEFEQRRRTHDLLKTLRRYVEFYEGASSTR